MDPLQVVAQPRRREILHLVWDGPLTVSEIAAQVDVTMGAVSQHLSKLLDAGLVEVTQTGRHRRYSARRDALSELAPMLEIMWAQNVDRIAVAAEAAQSAEPEKARRP